jgi:hypothetical protein
MEPRASGVLDTCSSTEICSHAPRDVFKSGSTTQEML